MIAISDEVELAPAARVNVEYVGTPELKEVLPPP